MAISLHFSRAIRYLRTLVIFTLFTWCTLLAADENFDSQIEAPVAHSQETNHQQELDANIQTASNEPKIVVSIKPFYNLVASIIGHTNNIQLLVDGTRSVHSYTLKPSDIKSLNEANLVIWGGHTLEPHLATAIRNISNTVSVINLSQIERATYLPFRENPEFNPHRHHYHSNQDPHYWLSPTNALWILETITTQLAILSPTHAPKYHTNKAQTQKAIQQLIQIIREKIKTSPPKPYLVFHDAYQYFEHEFAIAPAGSLTVHPEIPFSAKQLQEIEHVIDNKHIACIFSEPQFSAKAIQTLQANHPSIQHGILDPLGDDKDLGPNGYIALIQNLADRVISCSR